jgi:beta-glucanase (GH16 family)
MTLPRLLRAATVSPLLVVVCATLGPLSAARADGADPSGEAMPGAVAGWNQVYANDFTSANLGAFQVYNGPAPEPGACWASNHAVVTGGELELKGDSDPGQLAALGCSDTTYEDVTAGLKLTAISQTYGMYEVRARVDAGQGVSVGAQLWPTDDDWNNGIVFMEDNGEPTRSSNLATTYSSQTSIDRGSVSADMTQWHTYGVIWSPGEVQYTLDGQVWHTVTGADVPDVPAQLALQTESWQCGANSWEQCIASSSPAEMDMDVDWIVAYQASSPTSGPPVPPTSPTTTSGVPPTPTTPTTSTSKPPTATKTGTTSTTSGSPTSTSSTGSTPRRRHSHRRRSRVSFGATAQPASIALGVSGRLVIGALPDSHQARHGYLMWVRYGTRKAVGTGTVWTRAAGSGAARAHGVAKISASRVRNGSFTRLTTDVGHGRSRSIRHWALINDHGRIWWKSVGSSTRRR